MISIAESNLAKAASNSWGGKSGFPSNTMFFWVPKSFNPKQDRDPFSHVCKAKAREAVWQTDWQTHAGIIDHNSPQLVLDAA